MPPATSSSDFVGAEGLRAQHEQHRVDAVGGDHLARFAARPPSFAIDQAVLAGRAVEADAPGPQQHLAVDADIDAPGVGVCRQGDVAGADIAAAVAGPEFRRRKCGEIDLVAAPDDLVDGRRRGRYAHRRDTAAHDAAGRSDHVGGRKSWVDADRKRIALLAGAEHVGEHAGAAAVAGEVLEQQGRGVLAPRRHDGDRRQFFVGIDDLSDAQQPAVGLDQRQPFPQVAPADRRGVHGRGSGSLARHRPLADRVFHLGSHRLPRDGVLAFAPRLVRYLRFDRERSAAAKARNEP